MSRKNFNDLYAFLCVAREGSFTRAAAQLNLSQSALSHTVRGLEKKLGIRLLTRTTRSVSPTEAGERLLRNITQHFDGIEYELEALEELRDKPAGTVRITTSEHAANTILWDKIRPILGTYPDIKIELIIDNGLTNIVSERIDAGVRLGENLANGMIATRIGPDLRMAVVGTPAYFQDRAYPLTPHDLVDHQCINLRMPTNGDLYTWEFKKEDKTLNVRVDGSLIVNSSRHAVKAAVDGCGLAFVMESHVESFISEGSLVRVLEDWCPSFAGYHLYYPSRRQSSRAFRVIVEALKYPI